MALDPQLQALMAAPAVTPAQSAAQANPAPSSDALDPQLQALMAAPSAPAAPQGAPASAGGGMGWRDYLFGPSEAAWRVLSGTGLSTAGGLASLVDSPLYAAGATNVRPDSIVKGAQSLAYEPRTQYGQQESSILAKPGEWLGKLGNGIGDFVQNNLPASWFPPELSGAISGAAAAAPDAAATLLGARLPALRPNTVNVGLNVGSKTAFAPEDVLNALRNQGVKVKKSTVAQSSTEPTVIARTNRPLTPDQANAVSTGLSQDAIAQAGPAGDSLFGPQASAWGPFNPRLFMDMQGRPLAPGATDPVLEAGSQLGLKFTPEQANAGFVPRALQSLSGSAKLERELSKGNAGAVNAAVGEQLGLPKGTKASPQALTEAQRPFNAVYDEASRTGAVDLGSLDPTLKPFIAEARSQLRLPDSDLSSLDAGDLVTTVRQLRAAGFANRGAPRYMPSQKLLGQNQIAAADALDDALDQHIQNAQQPQSLPAGVQNWARIQGEEAKYRVEKYGSDAREHTLTDAEKAEVWARLGLSPDAPVTDPSAVATQPPAAPVASDLMQRLLQARQGLAQIASARQALRPGGNFFAGSFAKQLDRNVPLSGNMKTIGQAYGRADRSMQDVNKIRDGGPFNVMDWLAGDLGLSHWSGWAGLPFAATILGRPLLRMGMRSDAFQNAAVTPLPRGAPPLSTGALALRKGARAFPFLSPGAPIPGQENPGQP